MCLAGEKLIDHLRKWLEPDKLLAAPHAWEPGQEADIAAATLALFCLLPPQAAKFLETGVRTCGVCHLAPSLSHAGPPDQREGEGQHAVTSAGDVICVHACLQGCRGA